MSKIALFVALTLLIAMPAFAQVNINGPHHTLGIGSNAQAGASATGGSVGDVGNNIGNLSNVGNPTNTNTNTFNPDINIGNGFGNFSPSAFSSTRVDNDVRNYYNPSNFNLQGQGQDQKQKQQQGQIQGQDQGQGQAQMNNWKQVFINPRAFQNIPELVPFNVPLLHGKVGDWTGQVVTFANLRRYRGESVIAVRVFTGSIVDRIRLEDIEKDLLAKYEIVIGKKNPWYAEKRGSGWAADKVRYMVQFKDSAKGAGIGGGGQYGGSSMTGDSGSSSLGSILPGYNRSTADPMYIIKFLLIQ